MSQSTSVNYPKSHKFFLNKLSRCFQINQVNTELKITPHINPTTVYSSKGDPIAAIELGDSSSTLGKYVPVKYLNYQAKQKGFDLSDETTFPVVDTIRIGTTLHSDIFNPRLAVANKVVTYKYAVVFVKAPSFYLCEDSSAPITWVGLDLYKNRHTVINKDKESFCLLGRGVRDLKYTRVFEYLLVVEKGVPFLIQTEESKGQYFIFDSLNLRLVDHP